MDKVDRLLQLAKACEDDGGVHIITDGYCHQCRGPCRATENPRAVIILNDIPRSTLSGNTDDIRRSVPAGDRKQQSPISALDDDSVVMYEGRPTRVGDIPGIHSLTRAERAMVLERECGIMVDLEPVKETYEAPKKKVHYSDLFGYG